MNKIILDLAKAYNNFENKAGEIVWDQLSNFNQAIKENNELKCWRIIFELAINNSNIYLLNKMRIFDIADFANNIGELYNPDGSIALRIIRGSTEVLNITELKLNTNQFIFADEKCNYSIVTLLDNAVNQFEAVEILNNIDIEIDNSIEYFFANGMFFTLNSDGVYQLEDYPTYFESKDLNEMVSACWDAQIALNGSEDNSNLISKTLISKIPTLINYRMMLNEVIKYLEDFNNSWEHFSEENRLLLTQEYNLFLTTNNLPKISADDLLHLINETKQSFQLGSKYDDKTILFSVDNENIRFFVDLEKSTNYDKISNYISTSYFDEEDIFVSKDAVFYHFDGFTIVQTMVNKFYIKHDYYLNDQIWVKIGNVLKAIEEFNEPNDINSPNYFDYINLRFKIDFDQKSKYTLTLFKRDNNDVYLRTNNYAELTVENNMFIEFKMFNRLKDFIRDYQVSDFTEEVCEFLKIEIAADTTDIDSDMERFEISYEERIEGNQHFTIVTLTELEDRNTQIIFNLYEDGEADSSDFAYIEQIEENFISNEETVLAYIFEHHKKVTKDFIYLSYLEDDYLSVGIRSKKPFAIREVFKDADDYVGYITVQKGDSADLEDICGLNITWFENGFGSNETGWLVKSLNGYESYVSIKPN